MGASGSHCTEQTASMTTQEINRFLTDQLNEWPQALANFEALKNVKVKQLYVDGMTIKVQFNPARIVSSAAKVDTKSVKERKCFLCEANRPAMQRGIAWNGYTVLINPFPIFPRHLTIPDTRHTEQLISGRIADMLRLAAELDGYTVFYNGPRCGASAPDHMHFQAGNSDFLTIGDTLESSELKEVASEGKSRLSFVDTLPLKVFVIDAAEADAGKRLFNRLYAALPIPEGEIEPKMNLLAFTTPIGVRLIVVPRKRHRPSFYGTEGDDTMLLSPASVDMGGVFITPLEKDFSRMNADTVRRVFDELCLSADEINAIADNIK